MQRALVPEGTDFSMSRLALTGQKVVASDGDSDVQRTTKVDDISTFLAEAMDKTTSVDGGPMLNIIFSTYDSLPKVAEAQVSDK